MITKYVIKEFKNYGDQYFINIKAKTSFHE